MVEVFADGSSRLMPHSSSVQAWDTLSLEKEACGRQRDPSNNSSSLHQNLSKKQKARTLENLIKELFTKAWEGFRKSNRA